MTQQIVVVGAGGFGREVIDVIEALNALSRTNQWDVAGVVDDSPTCDNLERLSQRGIPHLGGVADVIRATGNWWYAIGIGNPRVRRRLAVTLDTAGLRAATLIHPSVTLGSKVALGPGTILCAGVRLTTNIQIGRHVHLNLNSTVGHDSTLGDFVSVNPLASISGDCVIADDVTIGVSSSIINGVTVGQGATVGGGACVVRHVSPRSTVVGVPAKPLTQKRSS